MMGLFTGSTVHEVAHVVGAAIYTSAQLKVKFINFDCSATTHKGGIIEMSPEPPASCSAESQEMCIRDRCDPCGQAVHRSAFRLA